MIKHIKIIFASAVLIFLQPLRGSISDELIYIHKVTSTEMNNIVLPQAGSLVYNTTENTLFFYTGIAWKRLRANGNETIIHAGNNITVAGDGTLASVYMIGIE